MEKYITMQIEIMERQGENTTIFFEEVESKDIAEKIFNSRKEKNQSFKPLKGIIKFYDINEKNEDGTYKLINTIIL